MLWLSILRFFFIQDVNGYRVHNFVFIWKVNHHFRKNNTNFGEFEHPRWGAVYGVYASKDIKAGDELFGYYGYGHGQNIPHDYPWYWEAKRELEKDERMKSKPNKAYQRGWKWFWIKIGQKYLSIILMRNGEFYFIIYLYRVTHYRECVKRLRIYIYK